MRNELIEVADYVLNTAAANDAKQCIDHLPGTTDAFRKVYWQHIESVRELLKNEGLVDFADENGYEITLTPKGKIASHTKISHYRTQNSVDYTTDKLLDKISELSCEIVKLKAKIRLLEPQEQ